MKNNEKKIKKIGRGGRGTRPLHPPPLNTPNYLLIYN